LRKNPLGVVVLKGHGLSRAVSHLEDAGAAEAAPFQNLTGDLFFGNL